MNTDKKKGAEKLLKILSVTVIVFFGLMYIQVHQKRNNDQLNAGFRKLSLSLKPLYAAEPSSAWVYVRNTATFIKNITESIQTIITAVENSGLTGEGAFTGQVPDSVYSIDWNSSAETIFTRGTNGSLLGNAVYSKKLRIFDNVPQLILEIYYNDQSDGGVLVRWMPYRTQQDIYQDNGGIAECQVSGVTGSRSMLCSFSAGSSTVPFIANDIWNRALVKVIETDTEIIITGLSKTIAADFNVGELCVSGTYYYPMAYIAKKSSPYYTTAKFGFNIGDVSENLCSGSNQINYGLFSTANNSTATDYTKYFTADGVSAADIVSNYPEYPLAANVDTLFGLITASGTGDGIIGKEVLDNLELSFMDPSVPVFP